MACGCRARSTAKYVWVPPETSASSEGDFVYTTEIQAKAKVMREGGTYKIEPK